MATKSTTVIVPLNTRRTLKLEGPRYSSKLLMTVLENPTAEQLKLDPTLGPKVLFDMNLTPQAQSEIVQALRMFS